MAESIGLIQQFVAGLDLEAYRKDAKTRSAVERQLQNLAEAAARLGEEDGRKLMGEDWRVLCDQGNVLRHAYHRIDDEIIWQTVADDLPVLLAKVHRALAGV